MKIDASGLYFKELNAAVLDADAENIELENCLGQRYIGCGLSNKKIKVTGTAGNATAAYLNGAEIEIFGNAQDATGDTMNDGKVIIHGSSGDATGYAMRGGTIFVEGDAGYRAGIHMKEYKDKLPVLVIGGKAGSFLGEYQAGGIIIVLNTNDEQVPIGNFCGTGMHGGKIYIRAEKLPVLPEQVSAQTAEDISEIEKYIDEYCDAFCKDRQAIKNSKFYVLKPNTKNPYKQMYVYK